MFEGATSFNGDIGDWDVSKVTDINLNSDSDHWKTDKVTDMTMICLHVQQALKYTENVQKMEDLCQWRWRGKIPYNNVLGMFSRRSCTYMQVKVYERLRSISRGYLNIGDVQVFNQDNNNMAMGKAATQSSTYGSSYPASKAVDGDLVLFSHTDTVGASVYPKQRWVGGFVDSFFTFNHDVWNIVFGNYIYDRPTCSIKQCRGGETVYTGKIINFVDEVDFFGRREALGKSSRDNFCSGDYIVRQDGDCYGG